MRRRTGIVKFVWIGIAALIVCDQAFVSPVVGLADNNDFPKITGRLPLCPEDSQHDDRWAFLTRRWVVNERCRWDSGLPSAEMILARAALVMSRLSRNRVFDVRYLGALHALLFLTAFGGLFLWSESIVLNGIVLLLFCDVAYVALFNSFYMDAMAVLSMIAAVVCLLWLHRTRDLRWLAGYVGFACLLIAAKMQHSWLAIPASIALVPILKRGRIVLLAACSALFFVTAGYMLVRTERGYREQALWNSVFLKLLPFADQPMSDLRGLGLDARFASFIGRNTFDVGDEQVYWRKEMSKEMGFGGIVRYYAKHPVQALDRFAGAWNASWETRPPYLGNFERATGFSPGTKSRSYAYWSDFKHWLGRQHPGVGIFLMLLAAVPIGFTAQRVSSGFHYAWLLLAAIVGEVAVAGFSDGMDWGRHLFLAQAMLDVYFCFAVAAAIAMPRGLATHRTSRASEEATAPSSR